MSVVIFSREKRSGKTTELFKWLGSKPNAAGILMPDVEGRRMFYDIAQKKYFPAQLKSGEAGIPIAVGSFVFDQSAFDKANKILQDAASSLHDLIVVDEAGKLELADKGFAGSIQLLIEKHCSFLMVVRKDLLSGLTNKFNLHRVRIIHSLNDY